MINFMRNEGVAKFDFPFFLECYPTQVIINSLLQHQSMASNNFTSLIFKIYE